MVRIKLAILNAIPQVNEPKRVTKGAMAMLVTSDGKNTMELKIPISVSVLPK